MCQADMSWIGLQKGPEIRQPKMVRRKQPPEKSMISLLIFPTPIPSLSLPFVRTGAMCNTNERVISFPLLMTALDS